MAGNGCGCGGAQGLVVGRNGIQVTGAGTPADPWVVSVVKDEPFCEIVEDCATDFLCPGRGLAYNDERNCLGVNVSAKPGNDVRVGSDGGLFFAPDTNPVDTACERTIESLPAFAYGGLFGSGRNAIAMGDAADNRNAVGGGLDMVYMTGRVGCDGSTWAVVDSTPTTAMYTPQMPTGYTFRQMSSAQISQLAYAWEAFEGQPLGLTSCDVMTLGQWLDIIQGRAVGFLASQGIDDEQDAALRDAVLARCGSRQVIPVAHNSTRDAYTRVARNWRDPDTGERFDFGVFVSAAGSPAATEFEGFPYSRVWIFVPAAATDAVIRSYVSVGLNVVLYNASRRSAAARAQSLGCRGILSDDGLYTKGAGTPLTRDPWCYDANPTGQIYHRDSTGSFPNSTGYRFNDSNSSVTQPPALRGTCGWHTTKGAVTGQQNRNAITPGWALPLPDWPSWEMTWLQLYDGFAGTSGGTGLIVCALDDRSPVLADGSLIDAAAATGYSALMMHATYGLQLRRMPSETGTPLAESSRGARPALNTWFRMRLRVTPARIEFTELDANGAPIAAATVASTDTTYRGRYMHLYKIQRQTPTTTPWGRVDVAFRNWTIRQWDGVTP
ncbi:hypothetical protein [Streptomyces sp. NPDC088739]|uniref:hypothetical protein n=1 Tax=Streptomyces sp. NPDC088739 TaxID=3365882 RepID=UPI0038025367